MTYPAWATNANAVEPGRSTAGPFIGKWNTRPKFFGKDSGDGRLPVSAHEIGWCGSRRQLLAALHERADEIPGIACLEGEGEGRRPPEGRC